MSTVAKKIMMGSGAVEEPYVINQSLMFNEATDDSMGRTFSSGGSRTTWTYSTWFKRVNGGSIGNHLLGYTDGGGPWQQSSINVAQDGGIQVSDDKGGTSMNVKTTRLLRDPASWLHIVVALDTTQGTAANRVKIYVNGVQETSFSIANYPGQNAQPYFNAAALHTIALGNTYNCSQYLSETHFIDGAVKTPSDFGKTNSATGQWIAKEYGGSYGTTGFYLRMASGAIGADSSSNSNTFSTTNLSNANVVIDTPTNNFATLNSAAGVSSAVVFSEGNLNGGFRGEGVAKAQQGVSTIAMPAGSGKWYWEMRHTYTGQGFGLGISLTSETPTLNYTGYGGYSYYNATGIKNDNGTNSSYGTAWYTSGQTYILSCYYDSDNGKIGFKLNGTDQGFAFTNVRADSYVAGFADLSGGTGSASANINFGQNGTFNGAVTAQGNADANGIGDFYYAPPSGYKALCTANLPDPAIPLSSAQFNPVLYTGNGGTQSISGVGFQPDWVWIKNRSAADNHKLVNAVRGPTKELESNTTDAEATNVDGVTAFASDGFALGDDDEYNTNNENYVSWNWKANGSGSTDTSGDIDCVLSANPTAGFSVLSFTGNGSNNDTIPHGLGVVPDFVWYKAGDSSWENFIYSSIVSGNKRLLLQSTAANSSINTNYLIGGQIATSSMISNNGLTSSQAVVAWCFASKPGFSKIGTYMGNGNTNGPFVNCGFKPAFVMRKKLQGVGAWWINDIARTPSNVSKTVLRANQSDAEVTSGDDSYSIDILANGFKVRGVYGETNLNNNPFLYMAFAEAPFKYANAH